MKYRYRAISDRKEEKRGILEAENQMQAVAMIRENGDLILELEQVHKWREVLTEDIYVAGMKDRDLALFSSQFAEKVPDQDGAVCESRRLSGGWF